MAAEVIRKWTAVLWRPVVARPWLLAAGFLLAMTVSLVCGLLLLANMSDSSYRFLPAFPDAVIVCLCNMMYWCAAWIAPVLAFVMFVPPICLFCLHQGRRAVFSLMAAFVAVGIGIVQFIAIFKIGFLVMDSESVARENLERKSEAERQGLAEWERRPIPRLRQMMWTFDDGHYRISRDEFAPDRYWLVNERYRPVPDTPLWEKLVLLEDIVEWRDEGVRLFLKTACGGEYELDYADGTVRNLKTDVPEGDGE